MINMTLGYHFIKVYTSQTSKYPIRIPTIKLKMVRHSTIILFVSSPKHNSEYYHDNRSAL